MCNYVVGTGADSVAAVREYGAEWWSSAVPVRIRTHTYREIRDDWWYTKKAAAFAWPGVDLSSWRHDLDDRALGKHQ